MTNFTVLFTPPAAVPVTVSNFEVDGDLISITVRPPDNPPISDLTVNLEIGATGEAGPASNEFIWATNEW